MHRKTSGTIWIAVSCLGILALAVGIIFNEWFFARLWGGSVPLWFSVTFFILVAVIVLISVVGVPLGIFLIRRTSREIDSHLVCQPYCGGLKRSERGELTKWSWSAFFGAPLWAFGSRLYGWGVVSLIPGINLVAALVLGVRGRRESWKDGEWKNFADFWKRQKQLRNITLAVWGVIGIFVGIAWLINPIGGSSFVNEACVKEIDTDGDLVTDWEETDLFKTNPNEKDTDGDGNDDFTYLFEVGFARIDVSDMPDSDNDGVKDVLEERFFESDPLIADMDGDGYLDGTEIHFGYNPNGSGISPDWTAIRIKRLADKGCN